MGSIYFKVDDGFITDIEVDPSQECYMIDVIAIDGYLVSNHLSPFKPSKYSMLTALKLLFERKRNGFDAYQVKFNDNALNRLITEWGITRQDVLCISKGDRL